MATASFYTFLSRLAAVTVSGVNRRYALAEGGPMSLTTADLPAQWVTVPGIAAWSGQEEPLCANQTEGARTHRAILVVAISPLTQDLVGANWVATVQMVDAVYDGLAAVYTTLGKSLPTVQVVATPDIEVAGVKYWGVLATVSVIS